MCWLISSSYISCKGPYDGGGSIIHIVDHLDLEALHHIRQEAQETSGEMVCSMGRQPAFLKTFSQRLSRGFNDVVTGFNDDGWSLINCDGAEDVITTIIFKNMSTGVNLTNLIPFPGGILCVKASLLLQDYREKDPEVIVLDPPDAIQHVHNRQSMLQDVADLNLSESYGNSANTFLNTELILMADLKLNHNYILHLEQLSISSYEATTHFESTVQDVLTMYRKITGKEYASTNQVAKKQMPVYQLSSKILCRVIDVQLKVEADMDKVFAQVTLLLESNV
ncbi:hypothetical protein GIB67_027199 [Kingdonia uniflora]|uniref:Uncharacterized protein n=1 Tax=Kingdonia uniflora TaxID=39325 RepID=A0A7J7KY68_9MAGN|nr:hypothetical protein GIB67_027199 [Kingdonia uniflora]